MPVFRYGIMLIATSMTCFYVLAFLKNTVTRSPEANSFPDPETRNSRFLSCFRNWCVICGVIRKDEQILFTFIHKDGLMAVLWKLLMKL